MSELVDQARFIIAAKGQTTDRMNLEAAENVLALVARVSELEAELAREKRAADVESDMLATDRNAQRVRANQAEAERDALRETVEFYADPLTYLGIAFLGDSPVGEFADDLSEVPWPDGGTNIKPGKRARAALAQEQKP